MNRIAMLLFLVLAFGSTALMIVNKSLKNSLVCQPRFRDEMESVEYVSPITGELKDFPDPWYCLPPGQGVLLKLTPKPEVAQTN